MDVTRYVVGFPFSAGRKNVYLMHKLRPIWQAGLLNGPGGKIEDGESIQDAMSREFAEECECWKSFEGQRETVTPEWSHFITLGYEASLIAFFAAELPLGAVLQARADEPVNILQMRTLPDARVVPNLRWLLPMAADHIGREAFEPTLLRIHGPGDALSPAKGMLPI